MAIAPAKTKDDANGISSHLEMTSPLERLDINQPPARTLMVIKKVYQVTRI